MEIRLTREHLKGSDLYERWADLENIFRAKASLPLIVESYVCSHLKISPDFLRSKVRRHKYVFAREVYCRFMYILTGYTATEIGSGIHRSQSTVYKLAENFDSHYLLEHEYRNEVHSIMVFMEDQHQEKIYKYLKSIK